MMSGHRKLSGFWLLGNITVFVIWVTLMIHTKELQEEYVVRDIQSVWHKMMELTITITLKETVKKP